MKMVAEYLDHALHFERLAATEDDPKLKVELERQAVTYRNLATQRAKKSTLARHKADGSERLLKAGLPANRTFL
jgi:hypothetical protein